MFPFMSELNETEQTRADIQNWNISVDCLLQLTYGSLPKKKQTLLWPIPHFFGVEIESGGQRITKIKYTKFMNY